EMVPDYSGRYHRDRVLFSVSRVHPRDRAWDHLVAISRPYDLCALPQATRRSLAVDLRDLRGGLSLFQSFSFRGAIIREDSGSPRSRAHTDRIAIQTQSARGVSRFDSALNRRA